MSSIAKLAKNTVYNISAYTVSALVSFLTLPLMLTAYGKSVYGVFALASSIVGIVALFDLGLTIILTKEVAQIDEEDSSERLNRLAFFSIGWFSLIGVFSAGILFLLSRLTGFFWSLSPVEYKLLRDMLIIHALAQLVLWPTKTGLIVLTGKQRFDLIAWGNLAVALSGGVIILGVLAVGRGPLWITGLMAIGTAVVQIVWLLSAQLPALMRRAPHKDTQFAQLTKRFLRVSIPVFIAQIAAFLMFQQTDRLLVGLLVGASAVALYEVAAKLFFLLFQALSLLISAIPPFVAKLDTKATEEEMATFFLRSSRFIALLMVPVTILLIVLAPFIIRLWVGPGYEPSITVAQVLLAAALFMPFYATADSIIIARDKYGQWTPYVVLIALLKVALSVLFVVRFGIVGVAFGTLISYAAEALFFARVSSRIIGYSIRSWLTDVVGSALIPGIVAGLILGMLSQLRPPQTVFALGWYLLLGVLVAALVAYGIILSSDERSKVASRIMGFIR